MTTFDLRAPALIGGVSQQGPARRLASQVEEMDNAWASPVDGLRKRHPSDHVATLVPAPGLRDARLHPIKRESEEYLVLLQPGYLQVFGTDGTEYPVHGAFPPYDPNFNYVKTRSGSQHLINPETFLPPWFALEDATAPVPTGIPGPYDFGEATRLGNANQTIGFDGRYQQVVAGTSSDLRKHFSIHVRLPEVPGQIAGIGLIMHEGGPSNASFEASWQFIDGVPTISSSPSTGVQVREVQMDDGWWRLETTYQPDGLLPSPLDFVEIRMYATGVLGPDHILDCFGAQLADTNLLTFENYPPYIRGRADAKLRATTVQDTTWIVNGTVRTERGTTLSSGQVVPAQTKVVWIRQGGLGLYAVRCETILGPPILEVVSVGAYLPGGDPPYPPADVTTIDETSTSTQQIAAALAGALNTNGSIVAQAVGSLLIVRPTVFGDTWSTFSLEDTFGSTAMVIVQDEVESLASLPTTYYHGQRALIIGTSAGTEDDYWVQFEAESGSGIGVGHWRESVAPGIVTDFDEETLPHLLLRKFDDSDGTVTGNAGAIYFEFGPAPWQERLAGDDESNPFPSFITTEEEVRQIVDVAYGKNRLLFVSGPNLIASEIGDPYNFWRTTVISLPDSDPIDVEASHRKVNKLSSAMPFQGQIIAFSQNSVFALRGSPLLSPRTVEFPAIHESEILTTCVPATSGSSVLWAVPSRDFSHLREGYVPNETGDNFRLAHNDISEQSPSYVRGNILDLAVSGIEAEMVAAMRADGDLSVLYIYKSHVTGGRRVQSAWWRYPFGEGVHLSGLAWIEDRLYLAIERDRELELECIRMASAATDDGSAYQVCLDRRTSEAIPLYDPLEHETIFTLPYTLSNEELARVVTRAEGGLEGGSDVPIARTSPTTVTVEGDYSTRAVWIGESFSMRVVPGRQVAKTEALDGSMAPFLRGGETLQGGVLGLRGIIHLDVVVLDRYGGGQYSEQLRDELGPEAPFGSVVKHTRNREFSVIGEPDDVTVRFEAHAHWATQIDALEWRQSQKM